LLAEHRTVWLAVWGMDQNIFDQLRDAGYIRTAEWTVAHGDDTFAMQRYDQLPEEPLAVFTSGMSLLDARYLPDAGRLDLLWSAEEPLAAEYTVSAFALDAGGQLVAQFDSFPANDTRPTASWQAGDVIYDPRPLDLSGLPSGTYTIGVKVYTWWDGAVFPTGAGEDWFVVTSVTQ
ncbi:MAG: hypothetical protein JW910_01380, partial [Anaerolineae bacterium]|nr:hypothetical protein [Anaerolineae bacterium]